MIKSQAALDQHDMFRDLLYNELKQLHLLGMIAGVILSPGLKTETRNHDFGIDLLFFISREYLIDIKSYPILKGQPRDKTRTWTSFKQDTWPTNKKYSKEWCRTQYYVHVDQTKPPLEWEITPKNKWKSSKNQGDRPYIYKSDILTLEEFISKERLR